MAMGAAEETWIDGFNLFHRWAATGPSFAAGGDLDAALGAAMTRLARFLGARSRRTVVFLDGGTAKESGVHGGQLRYRQPGPRRRADDLMVDTLRARAVRAGGVGRVEAVTDDRELAARLADLGARVRRVNDFLGEVAEAKARARTNGRGRAAPRTARERQAARGRQHKNAPARERVLSPIEVSAWLALFGGEISE